MRSNVDDELAKVGGLRILENFVEAARRCGEETDARPAGLSDSGNGTQGTGAGGGQGVGQNATMGQRLCGAASVSAVLAHSE
jgi:hypothetical protein